MIRSKTSVRSRRPLAVESLETRALLANLTLANFQLVSGDGNPLVSPAIGEKVYLKATWNQSAMAGGEQYVVRFSVDGVTLDTGTFTSGAGDGQGLFTGMSGWYASTPGPFTASVTVDGANSVAESDEGDNSDSFSFSATTQTPPQKISNPLPGAWGQNFFIFAYQDVDPTAGIHDFAGGSVAYNGHDGYDVGTPNVAGMDPGVPIFAAADGVVSFTHDGEFDRESQMQEPEPEANRVFIDIGQGWSTVYYHLRRDSLRVQEGDSVVRGQLLGYMGSSGNSTTPHLHFGLLHNGSVVETFYQPTNYWTAAPDYVFTAPFLVKAAVTNFTADDVNEGTSEARTIDQSNGQISDAIAYYSGLQSGDILIYRWRMPDNEVLFSTPPENLTANSQGAGHSRTIGMPDSPMLGTWHVEFLVNGVLMGSVPFDVTTAGAPEIIVKDGTATVGSGRYTPFDLGPVVRNSIAPTKTFTVRNHGSATLNLTGLTVPAGFSITEGLSASLAPGAQDTFTISLNTGTAGYFAGQVKISSNDADEPVSTFSVEGLVTPFAGESLTLGIADRQITEGTATVGHVRRTGDLSAPLTVNLAALTSGELSLPASVIIPVNATETLFTIQGLSDALAENLETIGIQATASGFAKAQNNLDLANGPSTNHAPVLDNSLNPALATISEDTVNSTGTLVSSLLAGAVTDADPGAAKGIAVVAAPATNGTWQFSTNGGNTWTGFGAVSATAARLIPAFAKVRFVPNANFNGMVQMTYFAWDQTQGTIGGAFDPTGNTGGNGAFSTAQENATQTITAVNDAPVLNIAPNPSLGSILEDAASPVGTFVKDFASAAITDADAGATKGIAIIGAGANGTWQLSLNNGSTWQALGTPSESAARLLPADATTKVRFLPSANFNGQVNLFYRAWDGTQGTSGGTFTTVSNRGGSKAFSTVFESAKLTITPVNDKPVLTLSGSVGYVHDAAAITLAPSATASDIDSPNFDTGQLKVRITTGASAANLLAIGSGFTVDASNNVKQGTTIIGTLNANGGQGTADLIVTFNANATPSVAQALVRAITFKTVSGAAGTRTVIFSLTDGDGGTSADQTKTVNVT